MGYFKVDDSIFDLKLSSASKLVYIYLCRCSDKQGRSFPSIRKISRSCSLSRQTVSNALKELVEFGLLRVEKHEGRVNHYQLTGFEIYFENERKQKSFFEFLETLPAEKLPSILARLGSFGLPTKTEKQVQKYIESRLQGNNGSWQVVEKTR